MKWFTEPVILNGAQVVLIPLEEAHIDDLCTLAKEASIWSYSPVGVDGMDAQKLSAFYKECIEKAMTNERYAFVIMQKDSSKIIGSTMFHSIQLHNKSLEIGCTWYHPDYWGSGINTECKYLLLTYCFETLGTMRVQLKTNDNNIRSRKAIEKLGATFEGILRKDKILEDGSIRNAAYYSFIDDDWPQTKEALNKLTLLKQA